MVSFIIYDLIFLAVFTLAVALFLYTRKHNLKRQGLLYLYRTRLGIKFIEWTSMKFHKALHALQYIVILSGYSLMIFMTLLLIKFTYFYITSPIAAKAIKVPVIIPLVPYLPELFKIDFLPPLFFTYWILIIAIIAVPHEFAHGIFARLNKIKIHSTGFGFLGPFLAAFVEQDEKQMEKASKFSQLSVLAAGTFANVVFTIIFVLILWLFFVSTFSPVGVNYLNIYQTKAINISDITEINGIPIQSPNQIPSLLDSALVELTLKDGRYITNSIALNSSIQQGLPQFVVYENTPAFNARIAGEPSLGGARIAGAITEINGNKILSPEELQAEILKHKVNDEITIKIIQKSPDSGNSLSNLYIGEEKELSIKLAERDGKPYIGVFLIPLQGSERPSVISSIYKYTTNIKNPQIYYTSQLQELSIFIYDLLWWIVVISISVALVNMLPLGIFDGGRFFYLTIWGLTGNKKLGEMAFKASTYLILFIIIAMMVKWIFIFI